MRATLASKTILLLTRLGYEVRIPVHKESGRTWLSKGLVRTAQKIATDNVLLLKDVVSGDTPLVGIEPSAILAFRDEYPELVKEELRPSLPAWRKMPFSSRSFSAAKWKP